MTGAAIPPAVIADAVVAAKGWLRAADTGDDQTIAGLCASAILLAEAFCGRALIARGWHEVIGASGDWRPLGARPVSAITGVSDGAGAPVAANGYAIDIDADAVGWIRLSALPAVSRLAVDYTAGDAIGWADVPPPIAQGVAMLVAHLFDDRDAATTPPAAVAALWRPFRRMALAAPCHASVPS